MRAPYRSPKERFVCSKLLEVERDVLDGKRIVECLEEVLAVRSLLCGDHLAIAAQPAGLGLAQAAREPLEAAERARATTLFDVGSRRCRQTIVKIAQLQALGHTVTLQDPVAS